MSVAVSTSDVHEIRAAMISKRSMVVLVLVVLCIHNVLEGMRLATVLRLVSIFAQSFGSIRLPCLVDASPLCRSRLAHGWM